MMNRFFLAASFIAAALYAQSSAAVKPPKVEALYAQLCASCHGAQLSGGSAPSLVDDVWNHDSEDEVVAKIIADGSGPLGMPSFRAALNDAQIRALVIYLREQRTHYTRKRATTPLPTEPLSAAGERFRIEVVADNLTNPWSIAFAPDGCVFVTERAGRLRVIENGALLPEAVRGTPQVFTQGQAGLLEVALHPKFSENSWIYLAYSDLAKNADGKPVSLTKIVRGRIRENAWVDAETIWEAPKHFYRTGGVHFGCRIAFDTDGFLFFSIGERGEPPDAQDLSRPNGKIHRIHDDGRVPSDNPFLATQNAYPTIWSYGHRNPQGLAFEPGTGVLWSTEHGPRGGDELNVVVRNKNYGWPLVTHGMNYDGTPMTSATSRDGFVDPVTHWTPSLAVCGIDFYSGKSFLRWRGGLLVTALAQQELRLLRIEEGRVVEQATLLKDIGRIRDVASEPDGAIWVVFDQPGRVVRLVREE